VTPDLQADARLALTVLYAFDMHASAPDDLAPTPDARLAPDWLLHGYITGTDAIWRSQGALEAGGNRVCYGLLLEAAASPGEFVVAIRGTDGMVEWIEDGEFAMCPHPLAGRVECGFWSVYESMNFRAPGGKDVPLASGIADAIGEGIVTVVGHSLGAALATFLTLDLTERPGLRVRGRFFASPRPGDGAFVDLFDRTVADYVSYARLLDAVPHVPFGLGYTPLHNLVEMRPSQAQARIGFSLGCAHHLVCYLAELDYALLDWARMPLIDQPCAACIKGSMSFDPPHS
jgi:triacylglycerol lipase